jgi:hypothetical protein
MVSFFRCLSKKKKKKKLKNTNSTPYHEAELKQQAEFQIKD